MKLEVGSLEDIIEVTMEVSCRLLTLEDAGTLAANVYCLVLLEVVMESGWLHRIVVSAE